VITAGVGLLFLDGFVASSAALLLALAAGSACEWTGQLARWRAP
jgi:hypothetical protein